MLEVLRVAMLLCEKVIHGKAAQLKLEESETVEVVYDGKSISKSRGDTYKNVHDIQEMYLTFVVNNYLEECETASAI